MTTSTLSASKATGTLQNVVTVNMRVAMAVAGVSQARLSKVLGMSPSALSQKMKNRISWSIEDMEKAGRYFNIEPAKFLQTNGFLVAGSGFEPETSGL